jgi:uncharacterized membrane protein (DUF373 family)
MLGSTIKMFILYCAKLGTEMFSLQKPLAKFGTLLARVLDLKVIQQVYDIFILFLKEHGYLSLPYVTEGTKKSTELLQVYYIKTLRWWVYASLR